VNGVALRLIQNFIVSARQCKLKHDAQASESLRMIEFCMVDAATVTDSRDGASCLCFVDRLAFSAKMNYNFRALPQKLWVVFVIRNRF